ncbi:MAG: YraN family protein [Proteobacteria bacterium]|jgi:putative endonuclease|nr:YraN family protein [Alphaproteobacteria bacterium]NCC03585.1 YraN family protein [Pseudomonadota bacterium]
MVKRTTTGHRQARGEASYKRGLWAETLSALLLHCKGYRLIERRYKTPLGEIDLIARKGDVIAIIEVKARPDIPRAHDAISPHQQTRLRRAAQYFLTHYPQGQHFTLRFDAIFVLPKRWPRHIINAFSNDDFTAR